MSNSSPADSPAGLLIQGLINQKAKLPGDLGTSCSWQRQTLVLLEQGQGVAPGDRCLLCHKPSIYKPPQGESSPSDAKSAPASFTPHLGRDGLSTLRDGLSILRVPAAHLGVKNVSDPPKQKQ